MKKAYLVIFIVIISATLISITEVRSSAGIIVEDVTIQANGRSLSALHSYPDNIRPDSNLPAVAVFHGFTASKEMLRPFTEGIARKGFVVITVDQQGHGLSNGDLGGDDNPSLQDDGIVVIEYLRALAGVDGSKIGVLGHSMGAATAISTSTFLGNIQSTVLLGNSLGNVELYNASSSFPANLFMGIGKYDELFSVEDALNNFDRLVEEDAEINQLYGSFLDGTARELLVTSTDHILEVINPRLVERSIQWLILSLLDPTLKSGDELLEVKGWSFIFDQFLSYLAGIILLMLIPLGFMYQPGSYETQEDFRPIGHGLTMFVSFILGLPFGILFGFQFIFLIWYAVGSLLFAYRVNSKDISRDEIIRSTFKPSKEWIFSHTILIGFLILVQLILQLITWDFRYVIPFLGALSIRRLLLMVTLYIPGILFFTLEIKAMNGTKDISFRNYVREGLSRIWPFIIFLLIYYLPIIFFQGSFLPGLVGFLAFFIVSFLPVMLVVSFLTMLMRSSRISAFGQAVIVSGLINWMIAMTLSFDG